MSETISYVAYYVAKQQKGGLKRYDDSDLVSKQETPLAVQEFIASRPGAELLGSYTETPESRKTSKWPYLHKALEHCKQANATLLIIELGTLTSNESFTHYLLASGVKFHCCDQPFVNQTILEALSKHAQVQRKLHGKLIREGLKMTSAKSGNPNAAEVISKVNKPKIDTAIVFACLLSPIIQDYRTKGYSQRQMVKALNEEGFTAPEGGKWVLSQLQKVLDRVRLNEVATQLKPLLNELESQNSSSIQIATALNQKGIPSLKRTQWDESQVVKLIDRIRQIDDIIRINQFVLHLVPVLQEYRKQGLNERDVLKEFHAAGIPIHADETLVKA